MRATIFTWVVAMMAAVAFGQALPAGQAIRPVPSPHLITILHTNDLHGFVLPWRGWDGEMTGKRIGGMGALGNAVRQVRTEVGRERVLLLDAGDAVGDTMVGEASRGLAVLEPMRALGYRAMTLGSHDFDYQLHTMRGSPNIEGLELLAANVVDPSDRPILRPYIIEQVGGVRVAILGLAYPNTPFVTPRHDVPAMRFVKNSAAVVQQFMPELRQKSDVVVVLSHLGLAGDQSLANAVEGIDVIIGGQSHHRTATPVRVGKTLIVQAGAMGSDLGRLDLDVQGGRVVGFRHELILLDNARFPVDPEIQGIVDRFTTRAPPQAAELVAVTLSPIPRANVFAIERPLPRDAQSPADMLFADAIRQETGADIALLSSREYGVAMGPGDITVQDVRRLIPQDSIVVTEQMTGDQIRQVLERSVQNTYSDDLTQQVGGMVQVSGLTFSYDPIAGFASAIREVQVGGRPLEGQRVYNVAVDSFLSDAGGRYDVFHDLRPTREWGREYEVVSAWMRRQRTVAAPDDVRMTKLDTTRPAVVR